MVQPGLFRGAFTIFFLWKLDWMLSSNERQPRKGAVAQQPQLSYVQRVPVGGGRQAAQPATHYSNTDSYSLLHSLSINPKPSSASQYRHINKHKQSAYIKQQDSKYLNQPNQDKYQHYSPAQTNYPINNSAPATPTSLSSGSGSRSGSSRQQSTPHPPFSPESMPLLNFNTHLVTLNYYRANLTSYEHQEIFTHPAIYFLGSRSIHKIGSSRRPNGADLAEGNLSFSKTDDGVFNGGYDDSRYLFSNSHS
jgi:hypothetical protein